MTDDGTNEINAVVTAILSAAFSHGKYDQKDAIAHCMMAVSRIIALMSPTKEAAQVYIAAASAALAETTFSPETWQESRRLRAIPGGTGTAH